MNTEYIFYNAQNDEVIIVEDGFLSLTYVLMNLKENWFYICEL